MRPAIRASPFRPASLRAAGSRAWLVAACVAGTSALGACGGDGGAPAASAAGPTAPATPTAPPSDDPEHLLTDAELRTADLERAPAADASYAAWATAATSPVRSLTSSQAADLDAFLPALLAGKRVVALGESAHGVSEFSTAKVRLVKYLHEHLGYDVLAFESSLHGCWEANRRAATLDARTLMLSCVWGVWRVEELLPLFEYVRSTQGTAHPLVLAGFDNQLGGGALDDARPAFLRDVVGRLDTAYARRAAAHDTAFTAWFLHPTGTAGDNVRATAADSGRLAAGYDTLAAYLQANRATLAARLGADGAATVALALALADARSGAAFVRQLAAPEPSASTVRDRAMADNIDVLLDQLYPGKKVMLWAHNAHLRHDGEHAYPEPAGNVWRNTGAWLAARRGAEVYTVGLFMLRGTARSNAGETYAVLTPPYAGSLESILYRARRRYLFLDLSRLPRTADSEWLFTPARALSWGTTSELQVLHDQYDGILFLDTVHPPTWVR